MKSVQKRIEGLLLHTKCEKSWFLKTRRQPHCTYVLILPRKPKKIERMVIRQKKQNNKKIKKRKKKIYNKKKEKTKKGS